jgi:hypothetical protein
VRKLIDRIEIPPGNAILQLVGNLEGCWQPPKDETDQRLRIMLVAGAGLEPAISEV